MAFITKTEDQDVNPPVSYFVPNSCYNIVCAKEQYIERVHLLLI